LLTTDCTRDAQSTQRSERELIIRTIEPGDKAALAKSSGYPAEM